MCSFQQNRKNRKNRKNRRSILVVPCNYFKFLGRVNKGIVERRTSMARPKSNHVQINISIPKEWKIELENLARIYSVEEGKTITFLDLMRRGIQEKYQLGEPENE